MNAYAIFAIYLLFWVMCAFIMLPMGIRTPHETGEALVPGQAESAPSNFRPRRVIIGATLMSSVLFGLYYANYVQGWIDQEMLIRWFVPH
jgi:predicted secreted protein